MFKHSHILRMLRFGGPSSPPEFSKLHRRAIVDSVTESGVKGRECFAHLLLLEKFAFAKQKVTHWAENYDISLESAWTCYINLAVTRFCTWFDRIDRSNPWGRVPPLDVLMIWHALMQEPSKWNEFAEISECPVSKWDWNTLLPILMQSEGANFDLPMDSHNWAAMMYPTPNTDLTKIMDMSIPFMQSRNPDESTEFLASQFIHKPATMKVSAPSGCSFYLWVDIHSLVERQSDFATQMLRYAWHRLPTDASPDMPQMARAIKRYARFIALVRHGADISSLEVFSDGLKARLVPTPDIELVWRTHRLSQASYHRYCDTEGDWVHNLGVINAQHVPEGDDLQASSQVYEHIFREEYARCHCWYCMAEHESPHFLCSVEQTLADKLSAETIRRHSLRLEIPLDLARPQCRRCGLHPARACRARDFMKKPSTRQEETTSPGASAASSITATQKSPTVTVRGLPITHLVPTTWSEPAAPAPLPSPHPSGHFQDGHVPSRYRTPPPRHQYRRMSGGMPPTPDESQEEGENASLDRNGRHRAKSTGKQRMAACRATSNRHCISSFDDDNLLDDARRVDKIGTRPPRDTSSFATTTTPSTHSQCSSGPLREAGDAAWWRFGGGDLPIMSGVPNSARPVDHGGIYCDNPLNRSTSAGDGEGPSSLHPSMSSE
ncbi:unnamed protein product [Clonostachys byssicola]|uniref:Uncharacterized protein n=1 Tax=Clonostachys byssicola TaxID=160290 RepID=A0A9N9UQU4_9HYPO|nr:unnamed protein product [Clonostachys byssicola]